MVVEGNVLEPETTQFCLHCSNSFHNHQLHKRDKTAICGSQRQSNVFIVAYY